MFLFACRIEQPKPNKRFFVLTCMWHDFPKEICVAGGTDLFLCTSPDDASLKGGCAENVYFRVFCGMFEPKMFLHVLFQTHLKPNDSDVKHYSHVKHSFCFCSRNTGVRETQQ